MSSQPKQPELRYVKLSENAVDPRRGSINSAGVDLSSAYDYVVPLHGMKVIDTDLQIELPEGCYGRIAPRSGLALKGIDIGAGVIDRDYRGNIRILLYNRSNNDYNIKRGDRVAQLICERIFYPELVSVLSILNKTKRGQNGFGSTGI